MTKPTQNNPMVKEILKELEKKWYDENFNGDEFMGWNGLESDPDEEKVRAWLKIKLTDFEAKVRENERLRIFKELVKLENKYPEFISEVQELVSKPELSKESK